MHGKRPLMPDQRRGVTNGNFNDGRARGTTRFLPAALPVGADDPWGVVDLGEMGEPHGSGAVLQSMAEHQIGGGVV